MNGEIKKDADIYKFVYCVCMWGGGWRVFGNLPRHNGGENAAKKNIGKAVREAADFLHASELERAIETLHNVKGLGVSYASKILRMLSPDKAVVFDSWLSKATECCMDNSEYRIWCDECVEIGKILKRKKIKNIARPDGIWKAADIEAVIFNQVRG